jgi:hypothetical protein
VDAITKPTRQKLKRLTESEFLEQLASDEGQGGFCRVEDYRAAVLAYGQIPCLWDQATWAVFGSEAGDGSGGCTPARERTPADLDLMETLLTIRESLGWQLPGRKVPWRDPGVIPAMMRQFAAHIVTHEPQHVEWWAYRFEQWGRLLHNHLNALDRGPRPVHLRNAPCPLCRVSQVVVERDGERRVEPAIVIDFEHGVIRAAQCQACGTAWWRGADLYELADLLDETGHADAV